MRFYNSTAVETHRLALLKKSNVLISVELDLFAYPRFIIRIGDPFDTTREFNTLEEVATWMLEQDYDLKELNDTIETINAELEPRDISMRKEDFLALINVIDYSASNNNGKASLADAIQTLQEFIRNNT